MRRPREGPMRFERLDLRVEYPSELNAFFGVFVLGRIPGPHVPDAAPVPLQHGVRGRRCCAKRQREEGSCSQPFHGGIP